jgi:transposase
MIHAEGVVGGHRGRQRRSIAEKRRIVELTFEPGASVAQIALANGVNANQVFSWRRAFKRSEFVEPGGDSTALLPVVTAASSEELEEEQRANAPEPTTGTGAIHIEFPGRVVISAERGADPELMRSILESLRK